MGQRYYDIHYKYVLDIFKHIGCKISFKIGLDADVTAFRCIINGKTVAFDFGDSSAVRDLGAFPVFKFHTMEPDLGRVVPFTPVSFYDWFIYYSLEKTIKYNPLSSSNISCRQRLCTYDVERRNSVRKLLDKAFKKDVLAKEVVQLNYWNEVSQVELAVFVPGFCNNILDRGHLQYMAFGCCTISPRLSEVLPFNKKIIPEYHYIPCNDDYSNLVDIIKFKRANPNQFLYKEIGDNAKKLFLETSTPEKLGEWIGQHL